MMVIGSTETNANIVDRQISADNKEKREILDKYLNSKGVENCGNFLTVCSVLVFIFENTLFKTKMDNIETIGICLIYTIIVIGAVSLLFSNYKK